MLDQQHTITKAPRSPTIFATSLDIKVQDVSGTDLCSAPNLKNCTLNNSFIDFTIIQNTTTFNKEIIGIYHRLLRNVLSY